MMKKSQRMNCVQKLADKAEQQQAERFSSSQQQWRQQQKKLDELQQYYREYSAKANPLGGNVDVRQMQECRQFLAKLTHAIHLQQEQVTKAKKHCEQQRGEWMTCRQRSMSLDKLTQRYVDSELREEARLEQIAADDLSSQRFVWSARSTSQPLA